MSKRKADSKKASAPYKRFRPFENFFETLQLSFAPDPNYRPDPGLDMALVLSGIDTPADHGILMRAGEEPEPDQPAVSSVAHAYPRTPRSTTYDYQTPTPSRRRRATRRARARPGEQRWYRNSPYVVTDDIPKEKKSDDEGPVRKPPPVIRKSPPMPSSADIPSSSPSESLYNPYKTEQNQSLSDYARDVVSSGLSWLGADSKPPAIKRPAELQAAQRPSQRQLTYAPESAPPASMVEEAPVLERETPAAAPAPAPTPPDPGRPAQATTSPAPGVIRPRRRRRPRPRSRAVDVQRNPMYIDHNMRYFEDDEDQL